MDAQEFMRTVPPKRPTSTMVPFANDLLLLAGKGYTAEQLLDFLQRNGVQTTMSALKAFMRRRRSQDAGASQANTSRAAAAAPSDA